MLLLGYNPLKGENYDETFLKNKLCEIELSKKAIGERYGEKCYAFLRKLLAKHSQDRYDAEEALASPFMNEKMPSAKDKEESSWTVEEKNKILFASQQEVVK